MFKKPLLLALGIALACGATASLAAERPYEDGTVWTMTMIRVKPGQFDNYMRDIVPLRKQIDAEAIREGIVISYHILSGEAANEHDFDFVILEEFKNWAAFDGMRTKYDAVRAQIGLTDETVQQQMEKRAEVRTIIGEKTFQELVPK